MILLRAPAQPMGKTVPQGRVGGETAAAAVRRQVEDNEAQERRRNMTHPRLHSFGDSATYTLQQAIPYGVIVL